MRSWIEICILDPPEKGGVPLAMLVTATCDLAAIFLNSRRSLASGTIRSSLSEFWSHSTRAAGCGGLGMAGDEGLTESLTGSHENHHSLKGGFSTSSSVLLIVLVALFAVLVDYPSYGATDLAVGQYYWW